MLRPVELDAPYVTTLVHRHDVHPSGFVRRFLDVLEATRDRALARATAISHAGTDGMGRDEVPRAMLPGPPGS